MRGKGGNLRADGAGAGITPAHAGKRLAHFGKPPFGGDHPRACGEKGVVGRVGVSMGGSPPRMRGKDVGIGNDLSYIRITPAHAGKSKGGYRAWQAA